MDYAAKFAVGLSYEEFLQRYGTAVQRDRWRQVEQQVVLTADQQKLLQSFRRTMHVLCLAGVWCGDCAEQCPIFVAFARQSPCIVLRFLDRDEHTDLAESLMICGGKRVPIVVFLSEDDYITGWYGDRTLAKYRQLVAAAEGPACASGYASAGQLLAAITQDWLNEFERHQWILRTSPRLRAKHGD